MNNPNLYEILLYIYNKINNYLPYHLPVRDYSAVHDTFYIPISINLHVW